MPAMNQIFIWTRTPYLSGDMIHMRADWTQRQESARQHARREGVSGPGRTRQQARAVPGKTRTMAPNVGPKFASLRSRRGENEKNQAVEDQVEVFPTLVAKTRTMAPNVGPTSHR